MSGILTWLYRRLERHTCDRCRRRGSVARLGPFVLAINAAATGLAPTCWACYLRGPGWRSADCEVGS